MLAACTAATGAGTTSAPTSSGQSVTVTTYPIGKRPSIPVVAGTTLDGTHFTMASLRGHVVVLNTWASWCEPCRDESPILARIAARTAPLGVRFVGVDEQDSASAARAFARSAGTTYPHVIDRTGTLLASLRIVPPSGIPSTLVLDPSGRVAARVVGPVNGATFEALVRAVVAQPSEARSSAAITASTRRALTSSASIHFHTATPIQIALKSIAEDHINAPPSRWSANAVDGPNGRSVTLA
jgi:thiol-disulfide isomerase/thioredoxin